MPGSTVRSSKSTSWLNRMNRSLALRPASSSELSDEHQCTWYAEEPSGLGLLVMKKTKPWPTNTMLRFGNTCYETVTDSGRSPRPSKIRGYGKAAGRGKRGRSSCRANRVTHQEDPE